jgi:hypothetical protein
MAMNKKQVTNLVGQGISEGLKEDGFKFIKSKERILREHEVGFDVIYARIIDYNPVFQIEFSIAIRLNAVEEIVNKFLSDEIRNPATNSLTTTIVSSYDMLTNSKENYIEIKNEKELDAAIQSLLVLIKAKGLAFFNKYKNFQVANKYRKDRILNDESQLSHILISLMQSLTLMKLCNDPDFDELSEKYKQLYVPWAGQEESGRKALDDLIHYFSALSGVIRLTEK